MPEGFQPQLEPTTDDEGEPDHENAVASIETILNRKPTPVEVSLSMKNTQKGFNQVRCGVVCIQQNTANICGPPDQKFSNRYPYRTTWVSDRQHGWYEIRTLHKWQLREREFGPRRFDILMTLFTHDPNIQLFCYPAE